MCSCEIPISSKACNRRSFGFDEFVCFSFVLVAHDTSSSNPNRDGILVSPQSRLTSDFEVIGMIGQGGFGHVFKVNRLRSILISISSIRYKTNSMVVSMLSNRFFLKVQTNM